LGAGGWVRWPRRGMAVLLHHAAGSLSTLSPSASTCSSRTSAWHCSSRTRSCCRRAETTGGLRRAGGRRGDRLGTRVAQTAGAFLVRLGPRQSYRSLRMISRGAHAVGTSHERNSEGCDSVGVDGRKALFLALTSLSTQLGPSGVVAMRALLARAARGLRVAVISAEASGRPCEGRRRSGRRCWLHPCEVRLDSVPHFNPHRAVDWSHLRSRRSIRPPLWRGTTERRPRLHLCVVVVAHWHCGPPVRHCRPSSLRSRPHPPTAYRQFIPPRCSGPRRPRRRPRLPSPPRRPREVRRRPPPRRKGRAWHPRSGPRRTPPASGSRRSIGSRAGAPYATGGSPPFGATRRCCHAPGSADQPQEAHRRVPPRGRSPCR